MGGALRKKLAIVGFSPKSRDLAPCEDPEWEIWSCNHVYRYIPRTDVIFEIHKHDELEAKYGAENWQQYSNYLKTTKATVYMMEEHPDYPNVKRLPFEELVQEFGWLRETVEDGECGYVRSLSHDATFKSTLAYMMAMAIRENRWETIAIYGVDMSVDSEWRHQRMNFSMFIGWARGAGIQVILPDNSALLREGYIQFYGYHDSQAEKYKEVILKLQARVKQADDTLQAMDRQNDAMANRVHELRGAIKLADEMSKDESVNGHRELFLSKKAALAKDLEEVTYKQSAHLGSMQILQGRRIERAALMEELGYHNRGEFHEKNRA